MVQLLLVPVSRLQDGDVIRFQLDIPETDILRNDQGILRITKRQLPRGRGIEVSYEVEFDDNSRHRIPASTHVRRIRESDKGQLQRKQRLERAETTTRRVVERGGVLVGRGLDFLGTIDTGAGPSRKPLPRGFNLNSINHRNRFLDAWYDMYPRSYNQYFQRYDEDSEEMISNLQNQDPDKWRQVLRRIGF